MQKLVVITLIILFIGFTKKSKANYDSIPELPRLDTLSVPLTGFTAESASGFIRRIVDDEQVWKNSDDTLKRSLTRLLHQYQTPFDSTLNKLSGFDFEQLSYDTTLISQKDTLSLRWLNDTLFFVDTILLEQSPILTRKTIIMKAVQPDSVTLTLIDSLPGLSFWIDSIVKTRDTITETSIDFNYLKSRDITLRQVVNGEIKPPLVAPGTSRTTQLSKDSSEVIITDYSLALMGHSGSPFHILPNGYLKDSLELAVLTLLDYTWERDSIRLYINDSGGRKKPFWLTAKETDLTRFWVKNRQNDSVTVWLGNPTKYELSMILEEKVNVERMGIIPADNYYFTRKRPDKTPFPIKPLTEIPVFWDYDFSGSLSLNQNYITYWAQGGESSFAGLLDLNGNATYTNTENETEWKNSGRLRFGSITTKEKGIRVNTDIIELNSQFNKVLTKRLDFSSVFYFKTQLAKGYNYPNDSVPISKFLNPGTFTIGIGVEYKPFEKTLVNFSPLSYKNTFVLDTANIDQTVHGVDVNRKTKQEVGGQLVLKNKITLMEGVKIANTLRLFSNYADKPQNLDVDWEMSVERRIAWIFSIKLNIHLIYDDDIRFPVELPEGGEKKVPRTQLNQFLGLSVSLNL